MNTNKYCEHLHTWQDMRDCIDCYLVEVYCDICNELLYEYIIKKERVH